MKAIFFALSTLFFVVDANADLECLAKKGQYNMHLDCPDGRSGVLDKIIPTDDIINVTYKVLMKNGTSKDITVPSGDLKDLIKGQYDRHASYPLMEKIVPYLNKKWKTKLQAKQIENIIPQKAKVSASIKLYNGLVEGGKVNVPGKSGKVDAVPVKARAKRITTGGRDGGQGSAQ